jgi:hypothetical protein
MVERRRRRLKAVEPGTETTPTTGAGRESMSPLALPPA